MWRGGNIHRIRRNIVHLMRGQVFTIDGRTFFTMGGAYSIDKYMRVDGQSWWKEELPDNAEYREASENLKNNDYKVDYIITHTAPRELIRWMGYSPDRHDMELSGFLEWVMHEATFKEWFFGHWHIDMRLTDKIRALYYDMVGIE